MNVVTQLGTYDNVTTVPLVAVQQDDGGSYVFAVQDDKTVKKTPITVTATVGDLAVLDGTAIVPNDQVVTEGQLRLADGSAVTTSDVAGKGGGQTVAAAGSGQGSQHRRGASSSAPAAL